MNRTAFLALTVALGACGPSAPGPVLTPAPARDLVHVIILHINDVYEIMPVEGGKSGGLARVATVFEGLKRQNPATLMVLGGDFLSPSAIGTATVGGQRLNGKQMVAVLNAVGVDWVTFGNHEFDLPPAAFYQRLAESRFAYVSGNVTDSLGQPFPGVRPRAVVTIGGVRVGLVAATIDANRQRFVRYRPALDALKADVAALRDSVDAVIAVTHLTLAEDEAVVESIPGIDAVLGGHEHENWEIRRGPAFVPIIKADANVRTVAVVDLAIDRRRHRAAVTSRLLPITDSILETPSVAAVAREWTERAFQGFRELGFEPNEVVARVPEPLDGREASVRNQATSLTSLIGRGLSAEAGGADLAFFNGGSIRIDDVLPPGPITQYDVIRILPFGGKVLEVEMKGSLLRRVLDQGMANRGSGGFLQWDNVNRTDAGWLVGGQPLDGNRSYRAVTTDFLLTGGEQGLDYLTASNPELKILRELRDVRMSLIDRLRREFP